MDNFFLICNSLLTSSFQVFLHNLFYTKTIIEQYIQTAHNNQRLDTIGYLNVLDFLTASLMGDLPELILGALTVLIYAREHSCVIFQKDQSINTECV